MSAKIIFSSFQIHCSFQECRSKPSLTPKKPSLWAFFTSRSRQIIVFCTGFRSDTLPDTTFPSSSGLRISTSTDNDGRNRPQRPEDTYDPGPGPGSTRQPQSPQLRLLPQKHPSALALAFRTSPFVKK